MEATVTISLERYKELEALEGKIENKEGRPLEYHKPGGWFQTSPAMVYYGDEAVKEIIDRCYALSKEKVDAEDRVSQGLAKMNKLKGKILFLENKLEYRELTFMGRFIQSISNKDKLPFKGDYSED